MLIDDVVITVKAGDGGNGAVTFHPMRGGPSGGNGGNGGDIYLIGVDDIGALVQFKYKNKVEAESGQPGSRNDKDGRNAGDIYLKVPIGTRVSVNNSDWIHEVTDTSTPFLIARGGRGGLGNDEFKSSTNQTPRYAEKGQKGQEKTVHLELRLIAQVGLAGLPNAGKSSLLKVLTNAHPKIGDYPFTTIEPNLGVMYGANDTKIILADIPGLIEGASSGKGLGIKFLKHIEKTGLIAHCIDITQDNLIDIYKIVRGEFEKYNPELLEKTEIIVLTKADLVDEKIIAKKVKEVKKLKKAVVTVSVIDDEKIADLRKILVDNIAAAKKLVKEFD